MPNRRSHSLIRASVLAAAALLAAGAQAQVYRAVGSEGRVVYSDKPLPAATRRASGGAAGMAGDGAALPYELRQTAQRFPVTLYTGPDCAPCGSGRELLTARGIPFSEKTVTTADDVDALKRILGEPGLPALTIGGQTLRGYADTEWHQYLDAAGYPKSSQLPANYRRPAPAPLVAVSPVRTPTASAPSAAPTAADPLPAPASPAPVKPTPNPNNPAGIRF